MGGELQTLVAKTRNDTSITLHLTTEATAEVSARYWPFAEVSLV